MQNLLQRFADGGAQLHPVPGRTTAYRSLHCRAILSTPPLHAPAGERLTVLETPTEFFHALLVSAAQQMLMEMKVSSNASRISRASVPVLKDRLMGLQDGIAKARQRITIGSLYIGTDAGREAELVSALAAACTAADRQELQVTACVVRRGCSCRLCCCATGNIWARQCSGNGIIPCVCRSVFCWTLSGQPAPAGVLQVCSLTLCTPFRNVP